MPAFNALNDNYLDSKGKIRCTPVIQTPVRFYHRLPVVFPASQRETGYIFPNCKSWRHAKTPGLKPGVLLPDEDSNLDKQSQSLSYYRYTIGQ